MLFHILSKRTGKVLHVVQRWQFKEMAVKRRIHLLWNLLKLYVTIDICTSKLILILNGNRLSFFECSTIPCKERIKTKKEAPFKFKNLNEKPL
jgi:hypothetical protein